MIVFCTTCFLGILGIVNRKKIFAWTKTREYGSSDVLEGELVNAADVTPANGPRGAVNDSDMQI